MADSSALPRRIVKVSSSSIANSVIFCFQPIITDNSPPKLKKIQNSTNPSVSSSVISLYSLFYITSQSSSPGNTTPHC